MARGMVLPVRSNKRGGADLIEGSPYLAQVISAGLTPNTSRNPFQAGSGIEVGIPEDVVFAVSGAQTVARVRRAISRFFVRLRRDELARLIPGAEGISFERDQGTGDLYANVRYLDLEADEVNVVKSNMRDAMQMPGARLSGF